VLFHFPDRDRRRTEVLRRVPALFSVHEPPVPGSGDG
jgi:hypothetical protein